MDYAAFKTVLISRRDRILTVTLNRPEKFNAIDATMHSELSRLFFEINRDRSVDIVILTGAGKAFSAGGDVEWLQSMIDDPWEWEVLTEEAKGVVMSILECRQPVICKLNGAAAGLGATIALACDVVFGSDKAVIGDPHVKVGFAAGDGGTALWPFLIGYARAREFLYTGELLTAQKAADIGLINHCVPAAELDARVEAFADQLANGAIRAIQWTKRAINGPLKRIAAENLDMSLALEAKSNITADHQEGVNALREKRKPKFTGK